MAQLGSLKIERPQPLSDIAADHIREAIINGDFRLGEALTENALSKLLGISKTPVREAISSLKREGILQGDSQKGARVFTLTAEQLNQLCVYRLTLESAAIEMAMKADPSGLAKRLLSICDDMSNARDAEDFEGYLKLDRIFHDAFFEFSGNQFLREGYRGVSHKVATLRTYLSLAPLRVDKSFSEHIKIAEFLETSQIEEALAVLGEQIDRGSHAINEIMGVPR
ncbi:GntR family transcriptional regulator [Shimia abyssi]|uniref:DNA-binding GntR family transcriptional regulator n=1 Tax=Shimia abyssi TaxID=1662395 RepID=A0A2P8F0Y9_9RHOB|nr:GntR family transcriptional regulator [Shimia abyssi]PSL15380.1 DNA-binding GntR family transcriptional regulator [Shimia abyssi]